jgi:hypothetical protein
MEETERKKGLPLRPSVYYSKYRSCHGDEGYGNKNKLTIKLQQGFIA